MRVLVLGGTGSIGAAVVEALVRRGHDVAALARSGASARRLAAMGAEAVPGDIARRDRGSPRRTGRTAWSTRPPTSAPTWRRSTGN
jgi:nucleoside-diphosphate-sugar epimerase